MTKLEMARVIAHALFGKGNVEMPRADNWKVVDLMRLRKETLESQYPLARSIVDGREEGKI